jgi:serine/threonine protein kinase
VEAPPHIGSVIGGYRIEGIAGRGGMGVVYEATQLTLERTVALKLLAPELADDDAFRQRFKRESRLLAAIDHPNVITVHEQASKRAACSSPCASWSAPICAPG